MEKQVPAAVQPCPPDDALAWDIARVVFGTAATIFHVWLIIRVIKTTYQVERIDKRMTRKREKRLAQRGQ